MDTVINWYGILINDTLFCLIDIPNQSPATQHTVNDNDDDILSGFVVVDNEQCNSEGNNRIWICYSNTSAINLLPNFYMHHFLTKLLVPIFVAVDCVCINVVIVILMSNWRAQKINHNTKCSQLKYLWHEGHTTHNDQCRNFALLYCVCNWKARIGIYSSLFRSNGCVDT